MKPVSIKRWLIVPFLLISWIINAQDTVHFLNNSVVLAHITKVLPEEIHYHLFSHPEGPLHVELKKNIKKVIYSNGVAETFIDKKVADPERPWRRYPYTEKFELFEKGGTVTYLFEGRAFTHRHDNINELLLLRSKDSEVIRITLLSEKHRKRGTGLAIAGGGIALAGLLSARLMNGGSNYKYALLTAAAGISIGAIFELAAFKNIKRKKTHTTEAISLYNRNYDKSVPK